MNIKFFLIAGLLIASNITSMYKEGTIKEFQQAYLLKFYIDNKLIPGSASMNKALEEEPMLEFLTTHDPSMDQASAERVLTEHSTKELGIWEKSEFNPKVLNIKLKPYQIAAPMLQGDGVNDNYVKLLELKYNPCSYPILVETKGIQTSLKENEIDTIISKAEQAWFPSLHPNLLKNVNTWSEDDSFLECAEEEDLGEVEDWVKQRYQRFHFIRWYKANRSLKNGNSRENESNTDEALLQGQSDPSLRVITAGEVSWLDRRMREETLRQLAGSSTG